MKKKKTISMIVPCFNEDTSLPFFYQEIEKLKGRMRKISFEIIFIDDGSTDNTLNVIRSLKKKDSCIRYISFSRNFGKEAAILAGLQAATGDFIATLDADLQDPPSLIPEMLDCLSGGIYDCAATRRTNRNGEPVLRSFCARMFYCIMAKISDVQVVDGARDFRIMTRKMVDAILSLHEYNRFSKGLFSWVGFQTRWFDYKNTKRVAGKTKWSFRKLLIYSFDGIISFSTAPLVLASLTGFFLCIVAFIMICIIIAKTVIWGDPVAGYPSMMSVILFIGGIQIFFIGIVGQYVSKTYLETKKRPVYIVKEKNI